MDGNDPLRADGDLCGNRLGFQCAVVVDDGIVNIHHRSDVHFSFPGYRFAMGKADVGNMVGLGRSPDLDADSAVSLHRVYLSAGSD